MQNLGAKETLLSELVFRTNDNKCKCVAKIIKKGLIFVSNFNIN